MLGRATGSSASTIALCKGASAKTILARNLIEIEDLIDILKAYYLTEWRRLFGNDPRGIAALEHRNVAHHLLIPNDCRGQIVVVVWES